MDGKTTCLPDRIDEFGVKVAKPTVPAAEITKSTKENQFQAYLFPFF
jgi:hypothetical protein